MFNPNLIVIKNKEDIIGLEKVKHDYTEREYKLKILNKNTREELYMGKPSSLELISIDVNSPIEIGYIDIKTMKAFDSEEINLPLKYSDVVKKEIASQEIVDIVRMEMDNPRGTMEEIEKHTIMIKASAYDIAARHYVVSKIKYILLKDLELPQNEAEELSNKLYSNLYGMGVMQELDDDPDVSEIMVSAVAYPKFRCEIYYTKTNSPKQKYDKSFTSLNEMLNVFARTISFAKKEMNNSENSRIETTRANGDRVSLIIPEASENYILNIRKFTNFTPSRESMMKVGTINEEIDELMDILVKGKANIGIGGQMGTGKTTFINYLLTYTKPIERKAIIANVKEVNANSALDDHDIIFLNVDDDKDFSFSQQMRIALRTTADRIILPETRGGEFKQVYEANLKTKGNIFTAHATDDSFFIDICADMYMEDSQADLTFIKNKISKSIDIVIIMMKIKDNIKIKSIAEVIINDAGEYAGLNNLFYWDFDEGKYIRNKNRISDAFRKRLFEEGIEIEILDRI